MCAPNKTKEGNKEELPVSHTQLLLKTGKAMMQHLSEMMLFLNYCIFSGSAEALVWCSGKL